MKRIYFDNNIFNYFVEQNVSSDSINSFLKNNNYELVFSIVNFNEISRCWKNKSNIEKGKEIAQLVLQLSPLTICKSEDYLIRFELSNNNTGVKKFYSPSIKRGTSN
jgi:hypothetical protein